MMEIKGSQIVEVAQSFYNELFEEFSVYKMYRAQNYNQMAF